MGYAFCQHNEETLVIKIFAKLQTADNESVICSQQTHFICFSYNIHSYNEYLLIATIAW